jgi:hypothetical protein
MAFPASLSQTNPFGYEDEEEISGGWGAPAPKRASSGDILKDAMKKEAVIKFVDSTLLLARTDRVGQRHHCYPGGSS